MQISHYLHILALLLPFIVVINAKGTEYRKMRLLKLRSSHENATEAEKKVNGSKESARSPWGTSSDYFSPSYLTSEYTDPSFPSFGSLAGAIISEYEYPWTYSPEGSEIAEATEGAVGVEGSVGAQALEGVEGAEAAEGTFGSEGPEGTQGTAGTEGVEGPQATEGAVGVEGNEGTEETQGTEGVEGAEALEGAEEGAEGSVEATDYGSLPGSGFGFSAPSLEAEYGETDYYDDASPSTYSDNPISKKRRISPFQDENGIDDSSITSPTVSAPTVTMTEAGSSPSTFGQSFTPHRRRPQLD